jgi:ubiquinone/menaquinone biosynthesis C-methylase UbiE
MDSARREGMHQMLYDVAQAIAPTWEHRRADIERASAPVRHWLVRALDPQPSDTVLELAAGNGDTGFDAASRLGPTGRLLTTDFAPAMLESARRRARALGVANASFQLVDAQRIELDDASVDGVLCRYGFMLMVDPDAAMVETRRVLRPGGRVAIAVWGPPSDNPFFTAAVEPLVRAGRLPPPDPDAPGVFRLADPTVIADLFRRAGFADPRIEEVGVTFSVRDAEEYVDLVADTAGPIGLTVQALDADERTALVVAAADGLAPYTGDGGLEIPGRALCAVVAG